MSKEVIKQYIHDVLKDIKLESKTETYWDHRDAEWQTVVWYRDPLHCEWTFKERAIRSIIQKNLGEFIDEVIKENKDFVDFFL